MTDSPLVQAIKGRKKPTGSSTDELLQMILDQVTKVADYFEQDAKEDKNESVTTQESHTP